MWITPANGGAGDGHSQRFLQLHATSPKFVHMKDNGRHGGLQYPGHASKWNGCATSQQRLKVLCTLPFFHHDHAATWIHKRNHDTFVSNTPVCSRRSYPPPTLDLNLQNAPRRPHGPGVKQLLSYISDIFLCLPPHPCHGLKYRGTPSACIPASCCTPARFSSSTATALSPSTVKRSPTCFCPRGRLMCYARGIAISQECIQLALKARLVEVPTDSDMFTPCCCFCLLCRLDAPAVMAISQSASCIGAPRT